MLHQYFVNLVHIHPHHQLLSMEWKDQFIIMLNPINNNYNTQIIITNETIHSKNKHTLTFNFGPIITTMTMTLYYLRSNMRLINIVNETFIWKQIP